METRQEIVMIKNQTIHLPTAHHRQQRARVHPGGGARVHRRAHARTVHRYLFHRSLSCKMRPENLEEETHIKWEGQRRNSNPEHPAQQTPQKCNT